MAWDDFMRITSADPRWVAVFARERPGEDGGHVLTAPIACWTVVRENKAEYVAGLVGGQGIVNADAMDASILLPTPDRDPGQLVLIGYALIDDVRANPDGFERVARTALESADREARN